MALITQLPAALDLTGVAGDPFTLVVQVALLDHLGDPVDLSALANPVATVTTGDGDPLPADVPGLDSSYLGQYQLNWTETQTTDLQHQGAGRWALQVDINGTSTTIVSGALIMVPNTTSGSSNGQVATDLAITVGEQTLDLTLQLGSVITNTGVQSVRAGTGVEVDNTDSAHPIVSVVDVVLGLVAGANITIDNTDPTHPIITSANHGVTGNFDPLGTAAALVSTETVRATGAETANTALITAETARATGAEATITGLVTTEHARASGAEATISAAVTAETVRATGAETAISAAVTTERNRATGVEAGLATTVSLSNETTARISGDATNAALVTAETTRATGAEALKAPLASPALTGTPTAPTQTIGDTSTKIATDAFVAAAVTVETVRATGAEATVTGLVTTETNRATGAEALKAPLASPALTGNPTAPTQAPTDNSTKIATTAYVSTAISTVSGSGPTGGASINYVNALVTSETNRATGAETIISAAVTTETNRATGAEGTISAAVTAETVRATGAEHTISAAVTTETTRATGAEATVTALVTAETVRATGAEATLTTSVSTVSAAVTTETVRATGAEATISAAVTTTSAAVTTETNRATGAEASISAAITTEHARATGAEGTISAAITAETVRATGAEATLTSSVTTVSSAVTTERNRATGAEALLAPLASPALTGSPTAPTQPAGDASTKIATDAFVAAAVTVETNRATGAEATISTAVTTETARATGAEATISTAVTTERNRATGAEATISTAVTTERNRATGAEALLAPLASPALTGSPTAPTQAPGDATTKLATDAFVATAVTVEQARATGAESLAVKKANNGSDFASAPSTRENLGIPTLTPIAALATSNVTSLTGTQVLDTYQTAVGDTVLLVGQTTGSQNGPWTIASGSWTRPADYSTGAVLTGRWCFVMNGSPPNAGSCWVLQAPTAGITVDTTATTWIPIVINTGQSGANAAAIRAASEQATYDRAGAAGASAGLQGLNNNGSRGPINDMVIGDSISYGTTVVPGWTDWASYLSRMENRALGMQDPGPGFLAPTTGGTRNQGWTCLGAFTTATSGTLSTTSSTLTVGSTTGFATSGTLVLNHAGTAYTVTYTGVGSGTTFTGCTIASGSVVVAATDPITQSQGAAPTSIAISGVTLNNGNTNVSATAFNGIVPGMSVTVTATSFGTPSVSGTAYVVSVSGGTCVLNTGAVTGTGVGTLTFNAAPLYGATPAASSWKIVSGQAISDGVSNGNGTLTVASCSTTSGSSTVTCPSGVGGWAAYGVIPGLSLFMPGLTTVFGFPPGTYVRSVSGNSLVMSQNADATATVTLTFARVYRRVQVLYQKVNNGDNVIFTTGSTASASISTHSPTGGIGIYDVELGVNQKGVVAAATTATAGAGGGGVTIIGVRYLNNPYGGQVTDNFGMPAFPISAFATTSAQNNGVYLGWAAVAQAMAANGTPYRRIYVCGGTNDWNEYATAAQIAASYASIAQIAAVVSPTTEVVMIGEPLCDILGVFGSTATINGSAVISCPSFTSNLFPVPASMTGQVIFGNGIPAGTTCLSVAGTNNNGAAWTVASVTTAASSSAGSCSGGFPNIVAGMLVTGLPGNPAGVYVGSVSGTNITFTGNYAGITGAGPNTLTFTPTATLSQPCTATATITAYQSYTRGTPTAWAGLMSLLATTAVANGSTFINMYENVGDMSWRAQATSVTCTNGSETITCAAGFPGVAVGQTLNGNANWPMDTTVASVSGTTVTLTAPYQGTTTSTATLSFYADTWGLSSGGVHPGDYLSSLSGRDGTRTWAECIWNRLGYSQAAPNLTPFGWSTSDPNDGAVSAQLPLEISGTGASWDGYLRANDQFPTWSLRSNLFLGVGLAFGLGGTSYMDTWIQRISAGVVSIGSGTGGTGGNGTLQAMTDTHGSAAISTPAASNGGSAVQVSTVNDAMVYLQVGTAGTAMTISMGHTSSANDVSIVASGTATAGQLYTFRLPAGWYFKWAATTATLAQQKAVTC